MSEFLHYEEGYANLDHVNQKYKKANSYNFNCVSCAIATDMTLGGVRVSAWKYDVRETVVRIENIYGKEFHKVFDVTDTSDRGRATAKELLIRKMSEFTPPGKKSRFIIFVEIKKGGHVFNAWKKGEMNRFLDGQNNKIVDNFKETITFVWLLHTGFISEE